MMVTEKKTAPDPCPEAAPPRLLLKKDDPRLPSPLRIKRSEEVLNS